MKKILLLCFAVLQIGSFVMPSQTKAQDMCGGISVEPPIASPHLDGEVLIVKIAGFTNGAYREFAITEDRFAAITLESASGTAVDGKITLQFSGNGVKKLLWAADSRKISMNGEGSNDCVVPNSYFEIGESSTSGNHSCDLNITYTNDENDTFGKWGCIDTTSDFSINATNITDPLGVFSGNEATLHYDSNAATLVDLDGNGNFLNPKILQSNETNYGNNHSVRFAVAISDLIIYHTACEETVGTIVESCANAVTPTSTTPFQLCSQIPNPVQRAECETCATTGGGDPENPGGVWTAVGCISKDPASIIQSLIKVGLGMSGGVVLLTFLAGGFMLTTSQGNPEGVNKAKEMMTASVVGLVFMLLSISILQFIGVTVLRIPGFGT
ncbi:MAG: hypothetical protein H6774_01930 [Pseudomonadales bacterium]|nr:hypothetical protein [Candidatus Woesebacteria bacterium]MCB9801825.1 hypothetical protein [Pseudomonadales bacterium]